MAEAGQMHPVDQAFYDLAVKERDYERVRSDRFEARAKKAEEQRDRLLAAIEKHERPFGDFPVLPELNSRDETLYRAAREVLLAEPLRIAREVRDDGGRS